MSCLLPPPPLASISVPWKDIALFAWRADWYCKQTQLALVLRSCREEGYLALIVPNESNFDIVVLYCFGLVKPYTTTQEDMSIFWVVSEGAVRVMDGLVEVSVVVMSTDSYDKSDVQRMRD